MNPDRPLMKWRLLDTGTLDAPENMALEKVLLDSCSGGISPNTLHLLEFSPCVLLGYNQLVNDEVNVDFCRSNAIGINRRLSGGGSIYMDGGTLGWEIIAKKSTPGIPGNREEMFRKLCGGAILMLSEFGIQARYRPLNDIEVGGRKISGAGGSENEDSFIFHGTVLVDFNADIMASALRLPAKKPDYKNVSDFMARTVCMRELTGRAPGMEEVKARIVKSFADVLGVAFENGGLSHEETESLNRELPYFRSDEWIYRDPAAGHPPEQRLYEETQ